jgi:hypothetical protein
MDSQELYPCAVITFVSTAIHGNYTSHDSSKGLSLRPAIRALEDEDSSKPGRVQETKFGSSRCFHLHQKHQPLLNVADDLTSRNSCCTCAFNTFYE